MSYQNSKNLKLSVEGHTLWVTLNNPDKSNALSSEMIDELIETLVKGDEDNEIRSIVITGEGRHFCAGGDLDLMLEKKGMFSGESNELRENYKRGIQKIPLCMKEISTPIIAMVNGAAIGAGLDLACMCDIRVASDRSKFGETFVKLGLVPGIGGTYFLQRLVGYANAMELTLTGRVIGAEEANNIGLVNFVVKNEELQSKTKEVLSMINSNAPIAAQMSKRAIVHGYENDLSSNLELLSAFQGIAQRTSDHFVGAKNIKDKKENSEFKHK